MAIALVGSLGTKTEVTSGTTLSPTFAQATTAGNLLICWITSDVLTYTNDQPGWTVVGSQGILFYYKENCGASETAPTFTTSITMTIGAAQLAEFSGAATTSPLEDSASASAASRTLAAPDAAAGNLLIGVQSDTLTKVGTATTTHTYNNGATALNNANNDAGSHIVHYRFTYGITTGNASADSLTCTDSSMNLLLPGTTIGSLKEAGAVATKSPPPVTTRYARDRFGNYRR